jgi:predicted N-formylglutamate amidohydrolase
MAGLLAADEPRAAFVDARAGRFVVVCEHAANRLPRALGTLGLPESELIRHIAWDPGAQPLAEAIAARLGGALVLQRYSRLAIDCNRAPEMADAIPERSEDTVIPGNRGLDAGGRAARVAAIWAPFHDALGTLLDGRARNGIATTLVTVHSFTPVYRGVSRPWHVGLISTGDRRLADPMLAALRQDPALVVGDNEPYSPKDNVDYTIRRHGFDRGLPHIMIEIRNDLLADTAGRAAWAERLSGLLSSLPVAEGVA